MFRGDSEQAQQADDDSGAPGARPGRGHRGRRRLRHLGPQAARGVLPNQVSTTWDLRVKLYSFSLRF